MRHFQNLKFALAAFFIFGAVSCSRPERKTVLVYPPATPPTAPDSKDAKNTKDSKEATEDKDAPKTPENKETNNAGVAPKEASPETKDANSNRKNDVKSAVAEPVPPPPPPVPAPKDLTHSLQLSSGSLDLQDTLKFGPDRPTRYQIEAKCESGTKSASRTFRADGATPPRLVSLIPPDFLTLDFNKAHPSCSFFTTEWNEAEKPFRQPLLRADPIIDEQQHAIVLKEGNQNANESRNQFRNRTTVTAYFDNTQDEKMQLLCSQVKSLPTSFNGSLALKDLEQLSYADDLKPGISLPPLQKCRMMVLQNEQFVNASEIFTLDFPLPPVAWNYMIRSPSAGNFEAFDVGSDMHFGGYLYTNPSDFAREIRVTSNQPIGVDTFATYPGEARVRFHTTEPWGRIRMWNRNVEPQTPLSPIKTESAWSTYRIEPHQTVALEIYLPQQQTKNYGCTWAPRGRLILDTAVLTPPIPFNIEVKDEFDDFQPTRVPDPGQLFFQRNNVRSEAELMSNYSASDDFKCGKY